MTRTPGRWTGDDETRPAPAPLDRVQSLVNTIDIELGQDRLARRDDARPWLVDNGLLHPDATLTDHDLELVRGVREALRALLIHNTGGPEPGSDAVRVLRSLAETSRTRVLLDEHGRIELRAAGGSTAERLGELLVIVRDAQRDGTWVRLKACANEDCRWAFYDRSRNRGGSWCTMAVCGNRLKNRDFRARRRTGR